MRIKIEKRFLGLIIWDSGFVGVEMWSSDFWVSTLVQVICETESEEFRQ